MVVDSPGQLLALDVLPTSQLSRDQLNQLAQQIQTALEWAVDLS